jgi:hypothetical protein
MRLRSRILKTLRVKVSALGPKLTRAPAGLVRKVAETTLAARPQVAKYCTVSHRTFALKTAAEFLKSAGVGVVLLLVPNIPTILIITVGIAAVAVFAERCIERQVVRRPLSDNSASTENR